MHDFAPPFPASTLESCGAVPSLARLMSVAIGLAPALRNTENEARQGGKAILAASSDSLNIELKHVSTALHRDGAASGKCKWFSQWVAPSHFLVLQNNPRLCWPTEKVKNPNRNWIQETHEGHRAWEDTKGPGRSKQHCPFSLHCAPSLCRALSAAKPPEELSL